MVELAVFNHRKHADAEKGLRKRCSLFERKGAWPGVRNRFGGSQDASRKTRACSHSPATTTTPTPPTKTPRLPPIFLPTAPFLFAAVPPTGDVVPGAGPVALEEGEESPGLLVADEPGDPDPDPDPDDDDGHGSFVQG